MATKIVDLAVTKFNGNVVSKNVGLTSNRIVYAQEIGTDLCRVEYDAPSEVDLRQYEVPLSAADLLAAIALVDTANGLAAATLVSRNGVFEPADARPDVLLNTEYYSVVELIPDAQLPSGDTTGCKVFYDTQRARYKNLKVVTIEEDWVTRP